MSAYQLHVNTTVLTLLVVLCAPVMMDIYRTVMEELAEVKYLLIN